MPRTRTIDRAIGRESRMIWIVTIAILLVGVVVVALFVSPGERGRRAAMDRIELGDDSARVREILGDPTRCPAGSLEHVRPAFPEGWPAAALDEALDGLAAGTAERWVYPISSRRAGDCSGRGAQTEIGIDPAGRVLWYVAVTGRTTLRLPPDYAPAPVSESRAPLPSSRASAASRGIRSSPRHAPVRPLGPGQWPLATGHRALGPGNWLRPTES